MILRRVSLASFTNSSIPPLQQGFQALLLSAAMSLGTLTTPFAQFDMQRDAN